jgi:hypothetical protein
MGRRYGFSFSPKRTLGISAARGKTSRVTEIPLTRSSQQRKIGRVVGRLLPIIILLCLVTTTAFMLFSLSACSTRPDKYKWELVATKGFRKFVYMSPEGLADKAFLSSVLRYLVDRSQVNNILFFDDRDLMARSTPMSDVEMLHQRAQYEYNPHTGHEVFYFVEVTDATTSPPDQRIIESDIRP